MTQRQSVAWNVLATSLTGADHVADGSGCHDAHLTTYGRSGLKVGSLRSSSLPLAVAVADGLGSRRYAAIAANLAVSTIIDSFLMEMAATTQRLGLHWTDFTVAQRSELFSRSFQLGLKEFESLSDQLREVIPDYDGQTTIGCVWLSEMGAVFACIGDAFGIVRRDDGQFYLVLPPEQVGQHANETRCVGVNGTDMDFQAMTVDDPEISAFVLGTDGVVDICLETIQGENFDRPSDHFLSQLYEHVSTGGLHHGNLNRLLSKYGQLHPDDMTMAIAWRESEQA